MFIYLFSRFLHNPKLLLTDLRSEHYGRLALLAASLAVATAALAGYLMFHVYGGFIAWLFSSGIALISVVLAGGLYLSVVHLFGEKYLPGSRASDLLAYAAFGLSPLFLTLPLSLIFLFFRHGPALYGIAFFLIIVKIIINIVYGVKENYQLKSSGRAFWLLIKPLVFLFLFMMVNLILTALLFIYG